MTQDLHFTGGINAAKNFGGSFAAGDNRFFARNDPAGRAQSLRNEKCWW